MYVTRPLSLLLRSPELLNMRQEGPNSGFLVLFDEDCERTNCFGCKETSIRSLPFPQNKNLTILYSQGETTDTDPVLFLPCLDQPLSSNRYYVIPRKGKHKGKAVASSNKEDMGTFCCCTFIKDVKPKPLDLSDTYQQVEIIQKRRGSFTAVSVASGGNPPLHLRRKYWSVTMSRPRLYKLNEASGLDSYLRARLPSFNFSLSSEASDAVVVGKWYCPFVFVKEHGNVKLKDQMKMSTFYEATLEQRWDKIFGTDGDGGNRRAEVVVVDVVVEREAVFVGRRKGVRAERDSENGVIWFRSCDVSNGEEGVGVGLSTKIMERIKWEQETGGWVDGSEKQVRVERREKFDGPSYNWTKFGCYVLVERFVLKRMDKSIVLEYDFKHTHQIQCKWE